MDIVNEQNKGAQEGKLLKERRQFAAHALFGGSLGDGIGRGESKIIVAMN